MCVCTRSVGHHCADTVFSVAAIINYSKLKSISNGHDGCSMVRARLKCETVWEVTLILYVLRVCHMECNMFRERVSSIFNSSVRRRSLLIERFRV